MSVFLSPQCYPYRFSCFHTTCPVPTWPTISLFLHTHDHQSLFSCPPTASHVCFPVPAGPPMFDFLYPQGHIWFPPFPSHPPKAVFMSLTGHPCLFSCPHTATLFSFPQRPPLSVFLCPPLPVSLFVGNLPIWIVGGNASDLKTYKLSYFLNYTHPCLSFYCLIKK